ncbi:MAG: Arc family DNA-binding protein [Luteolibacter sp.]
MATLTIRNLPEELHEALKIRAKRNLRSLNQEVIAELRQVAAVETDEERRVRVELEIAAVDALRSRAKGFLTAEEIDGAKRAGRA